MLKLGQPLFIVVCQDRHMDLGLSIHLTRAGADATIAKFQSSYEGDGYTWAEENWGAPKWVRYVSSGGGDGPRAYIEVVEVME